MNLDKTQKKFFNHVYLDHFYLLHYQFLLSDIDIIMDFFSLSTNVTESRFAVGSSANTITGSVTNAVEGGVPKESAKPYFPPQSPHVFPGRKVPQTTRRRAEAIQS